MIPLIRFLLNFIEILFVVYWIAPVLHAPVKTKAPYLWVDRLFSPLLSCLRRFISKHIPAKYMIIDWSYVAVFAIIGIVRFFF